MVRCSPPTHSLIVLCVAFFGGLLKHILAPFLLSRHPILLLAWDSLIIILIYTIVSSITWPLYILSIQCLLFVSLLFPVFYSFLTSFSISLCKVRVRGGDPGVRRLPPGGVSLLVSVSLHRIRLPCTFLPFWLPIEKRLHLQLC